MKINPPKAIIGKEDPFEHTLFGRKEFAESLTSLLRNVEENLVIFVNAPWGEGKTTFAEMWRAQLNQRNLDVIYFDAFAADYFDDPFVSFSGEILELADKKLSEGKGLIERQEFKQTAVEVGKRLTSLVAKVGLRAITFNAVEPAHLEELKEIAAGVSEIGADVIEKEIENYTTEKDALKKFKESLAKLASKVREEQKFPLTIIVDELDRCRPDFALGLLERIKHLFDVKDVAFVLLVNRNQIENYIRTVYGSGDAEAYLLKFGNLFVDLPNQRHANSNFQYVSGRKEFCLRLVGHFDISSRVRNGHQVAIYMTVLANHFDLTLREIEKAFTSMAIYYSSITQEQSNNDFLTSLLSILKIKKPIIYQSLSKSKISASQFFTDSLLNQLNVGNEHEFNWEWLRDMLDFYLMSDTELEIATNAGNTQIRSGLKQMSRYTDAVARKNVIPTMCLKLDRFSLNPQ
jgi:hypothetical protein